MDAAVRAEMSEMKSGMQELKELLLKQSQVRLREMWKWDEFVEIWQIASGQALTYKVQCFLHTNTQKHTHHLCTHRHSNPPHHKLQLHPRISGPLDYRQAKPGRYVSVVF